ncbi:MAG: TetR/AcrR family transcriptional regulator [Acidobacteria bacterium]|nr:TetR/AcrR family transcriptional regulator [Acidobacteriota bacterium]
MSEVSSGRRTELKRPSQARSIATFSSILDASTQIIVERGVQGLNTNLVAERAGVNIGTVYHYFPDKTAILVELFRTDLARRLAHLTEKLREVSSTPDLNQWTIDIFTLALELRSHHPATQHLRRAFRAVPELVELDRRETEDLVEFFASRLRMRFTLLSASRARAAARLLIEFTSIILDVGYDNEDVTNDIIDEGVAALRSYLVTLED